MMVEKKLQDSVTGNLSLKEDLPSMYILNTLAKHYSPGVLNDKRIFKENAIKGRWAVVKGYLQINIYNFLALAFVIDVLVRCVTARLVLDNSLTSPALLMGSIFIFIVTFLVTSNKNKNKYSLLTRLWAIAVEKTIH